jgi:hypothetical protein
MNSVLLKNYYVFGTERISVNSNEELVRKLMKMTLVKDDNISEYMKHFAERAKILHQTIEYVSVDKFVNSLNQYGWIKECA